MINQTKRCTAVLVRYSTAMFCGHNWRSKTLEQPVAEPSMQSTVPHDLGVKRVVSMSDIAELTVHASGAMYKVDECRVKPFGVILCSRI